MIEVPFARHLTDSHLDWWTLAGLETLTDEAPRNWLAAPADVPIKSQPAASAPRADQNLLLQKRRTVEPPQEISSPQAPLAPLAMPGEWDAFQQWLASDDRVPGTGWHQQRILPSGPQGAALMLLSLTPEMDDYASGNLHGGAPGVLLDAMLRAIGLTRAQCYLASLAMTRPPGGRLGSGDIAALTPLLWHHIRLARPDRLLIFGSDLAQLLASTDLAAARGQLLIINHDGVKVEAVAIQHPLLLLDRPARKAAAWDSLKRLAQG